MLPYKPIDCNFYDILLEKATSKKKTTIIFKESDTETTKIDAVIQDVFTEKGSEFLQTEKGQIIRLDTLISVGTIKLEGFNCSIN